MSSARDSTLSRTKWPRGRRCCSCTADPATPTTRCSARGSIDFADTHQVVYLDHRGQGRSDERQVATGWNLDTWADDVVRFCDAVGIESPVVFGQSFGGMVAMHYAARHPTHPSKLVLSSTEARRHRSAALDMFERLGGAEARETLNHHSKCSPDSMNCACRCTTERRNRPPARDACG
jgi:proline iminopeptidase